MDWLLLAAFALVAALCKPDAEKEKEKSDELERDCIHCGHRHRGGCDREPRQRDPLPRDPGGVKPEPETVPPEPPAVDPKKEAETPPES